MKIILLGAPGSGKGTQANLIRRKFNIPVISTGDMIREALKSGTEIGNKAKTFVEKGKLVPDEIVIGIMKDRLKKNDCKNGFILDGFPRTISQAEALDEMGIMIDYVIDIESTEDIIIERISGRRVCTNCGATYHITNMKPKRDGICDKCAKTLSQRKDDKIETVKKRLEVYYNETEPLKGYYKSQNKLFEVDGTKSLEEVSNLIIDFLEAK